MKRCLGCMEIFNEGTVCPHCGYSEGTAAEEIIHLIPGTALHKRYSVGKVIGYGGFGVTYIGWDQELERKVAIKEYLPTEFSTRMPGHTKITVLSGDRHEQFMSGLNKYIDEARRLAKFQNEPGVVRIFETFEENDTAYIVMEFLDGETLNSYIEENGVIDEAMAVEIMKPLMSSLEHVHAAGILHRDISPDNIFLTKSGDVKLIDFGASRFATATHSRSLTVIIKPGYSAEEQYNSRGDQGEWTDVYSLGAVLYKMLTGMTPTDALERHFAIEQKKRDALVSPEKLNKAITSQTAVTIMNALNLKVEDRTPDVETFRRELTGDIIAVRHENRIKKLDFYRLPLWSKIAVPVAIIMLLLFGILIFTGYFDSVYAMPEGYVRVPDILWIDPKEAKTMLEGSVLGIRISGNVNYERLEDGLIVYQSPLADSILEKNKSVSVKVNIASLDVAENEMPFVETFTLDEAKKRINDAGVGKVEIVINEDYSDDYEAGIIMKQDPVKGEAAPEKIILTISKGAKPFELTEDVTGLTEEEARALLANLGLVVEVVYVSDEKYAQGEVICQSIEKSSYVRKGDEIVLQVVEDSAKLVNVPNVVNQDQTIAENLLKKTGMNVQISKEFSETVPKGQVIRQSMNGKQRKNSAVVIYVSDGPDMTSGNEISAKVTADTESPTSADTVPAEVYTQTLAIPSQLQSETFFAEECADHIWGSWEVLIPEDCLFEGLQIRSCSVCGLIEGESIPSTPHTWGPWEEDSPAHCCYEGWNVRYCSVCGSREWESIPIIPHTWGPWEEDSPADCNYEGWNVRRCSVCGADEWEMVPPTAHTWGSWEEFNPASCFTDGSNIRTCALCGATEYETIPAVTHIWGPWEPYIAADCCNEGWNIRTCSMCGSSEQEAVPMLSHTPGEWEIESVYTFENGFVDVRVLKCTQCGTVLQSE